MLVLWGSPWALGVTHQWLLGSWLCTPTRNETAPLALTPVCPLALGVVGLQTPPAGSSHYPSGIFPPPAVC